MTEALDRLLRCREELGANVSNERQADQTFVTLVGHLGYDAALIEIVRLLGLPCDASEFDRPDRARARLEGILAGRGIGLAGGGPGLLSAGWDHPGPSPLESADPPAQDG